ncbi:uncharacterized protein LOC133784169 [Humulus lupulus]|uniref:uncharacterized protein LOC133784169 n=1 Tax=Humulus lupulus TaxID=3486 RepID=UPI002B40D6D5|nr:uncharacterized protein LOC133784169 [Humulus lupulus]
MRNLDLNLNYFRKGDAWVHVLKVSIFAVFFFSRLVELALSRRITMFPTRVNGTVASSSSLVDVLGWKLPLKLVLIRHRSELSPPILHLLDQHLLNKATLRQSRINSMILAFIRRILSQPL